MTEDTPEYGLGEDVTHLARSTKEPGAVVSVRFTAADIDLIGRAAEAIGVPMVQYIHDAALGTADLSLAAKWKDARKGTSYEAGDIGHYRGKTGWGS